MTSPTRSSTTPFVSMTLKMTAQPLKVIRDSLILIQIGETGFLTPIGRLEFLTLIIVGKEDTQILKNTE